MMTTTRHVDHAEFKRLYERGMNRKDMAEHFGISVDAASRLRAKLELPPWANSTPSIPIEEFKAAYAESNSVAELAEKTGYQESTVRGRIQALDLELYPNGYHDPMISDEDFKRICAESKTTREVAEKTGYDRSTVNSKMKDAGIPPYQVATGQRFDHDYIVELLGTDMTYAAIARRVGCSHRVVDRVVKKHPELRRADPKRALTQEELDRAKEMLDDGTPYSEVGRTLGRDYKNLQRRLPGYTWTPAQVMEHARMMRQMGELMKDSTNGSGYAYNGVTPTRNAKARGEHNA
jgi:hypothetical protein